MTNFSAAIEEAERAAAGTLFEGKYLNYTYLKSIIEVWKLNFALWLCVSLFKDSVCTLSASRTPAGNYQCKSVIVLWGSPLSLLFRV